MFTCVVIIEAAISYYWLLVYRAVFFHVSGHILCVESTYKIRAEAVPKSILGTPSAMWKAMKTPSLKDVLYTRGGDASALQKCKHYQYFFSHFVPWIGFNRGQSLFKVFIYCQVPLVSNKLLITSWLPPQLGNFVSKGAPYTWPIILSCLRMSSLGLSSYYVCIELSCAHLCMFVCLRAYIICPKWNVYY